MALALVAVVFVLADGGHAGAATAKVRTPVDLATPIDLGNGLAHPSAIVRSGDARFEVLTPTLIRLEYSESGRFEDQPTVNAIDRRMPVPPYRVSKAAGWLMIRTTKMLVRYKVGSGPFSTQNTALEYTVDGHAALVQPTWDWECPFDQVCQAGSATLGGGATLGQTFAGYDSTAGYVGYFIRAGASATWQVLGAPAGPAVVALRYSNTPTPPLAPVESTLRVVVNGHDVDTLSAPPTNSATAWETLQTTVNLRAGTNSVELVSTTPKSYDLGLDTISIGPAGAPPPTPAQNQPLGGWIRGFDTDTYNITPSCVGGESGATCQAGFQPLNTDGLLDGAGWRLLDDTQSATWTRQGWVQPRPAHGDIEDGYLFAYGHDYLGALGTLARLTGSAPLLPRDVFGVWYSDYTPYSSTTIEHSLYPAFVAHHVPLDTLSLDTDWKAPNDWNGWEWNPTFFPDPAAFLHWAAGKGVDVTLNIHSSIDDNDPKLPAAQRVAGHTLSSSSCTNGACKVWDWSSVPQAESNFSLQQSFERQGVSFWWLDWCCDASTVSMSGVTPDAWIDHLYAQEMTNRGQRGFVLARIGGSNGQPEQVYPAGPWSDHTSTIAFTGDAWGTWNTLAQEAALTSAEGTIGEPYVSSDIGSFLGPPPTQAGADPPDLYDRWVQLGTFQPILRLHSNNEDRLPWQYPSLVKQITEAFLRLRDALIPYTYSLAAQAHETGVPMARSLYLDFPSQTAAYSNPTEYLYGPDVLVAPVTTPGATAEATVWFPPGRWVDYFTGATFVGPSSATLNEPLDRMPVFVRAGGIIPEQPSTAKATTPLRVLNIKAYAGSSGSFHLYQDAGTGLRYERGARSETTMAIASGGSTPSTKVVIAATRGHYGGQPANVTYHLDLIGLSRPTSVTLDGVPLREGPAQASWSYDGSTDTVAVTLGTRSIRSVLTVVEHGGQVVDRAEPSVAAVP